MKMRILLELNRLFTLVYIMLVPPIYNTC